jgi:hypothetical protein
MVRTKFVIETQKHAGNMAVTAALKNDGLQLAVTASFQRALGSTQKTAIFALLGGKKYVNNYLVSIV